MQRRPVVIERRIPVEIKSPPVIVEWTGYKPWPGYRPANLVARRYVFITPLHQQARTVSGHLEEGRLLP